MSEYFGPQAQINVLADIVQELRTANTLKVMELGRKMISEVDHESLEETMIQLVREYLK